ncbi:MAG: helix-turn-helix transcriptional regulator [Clostridia bacterium]|nr:helix-turn-helix transcriptional regulator [Clostridia bacterium]
MNQIKIGRFIAECRKKKELTQMQLAEKLDVTDRAVSKWETGRAMPDTSIMLDLCQELGITVNDLLCGEVISMENKEKVLEERLLELVEDKERADKRLLNMEIVIGVISVLFLLVMTFIPSFVEMETWLRITTIVVGFVVCLVGVGFALRIEQIAGYYECKNCGHRYVPKFSSVFWAMHNGRTRYLKCPECGKRTWNKKVISKKTEK